MRAEINTLAGQLGWTNYSGGSGNGEKGMDWRNLRGKINGKEKERIRMTLKFLD